jgi:hypothetical protein
MNPVCVLIILILSSLCNTKLVQVVSFFRHGSRYAITADYDGNDTRYTWG